MDIAEEYSRWVKLAQDSRVQRQLAEMADSPEAIQDGFYKPLAFGTGGLRGVLGAGTNRMNVYTVTKATLGLADYLNARRSGSGVVIGYDSRNQSREFAETAAAVFSAMGIRVHLYPQLTPVPTVSFGVRRLGADAGVMITASHNPAKYNGYKVYGADGCQITTQAAAEILAAMEKRDYFEPLPLAKAPIEPVAREILTEFLNQVKSQSVLFGDSCKRDLKIVYTPLCGAGLVPVTRILRESGFRNVTVVPEQEKPNGDFPTCPYPNPEIREAMELGIQTCSKSGADLLLATDPDCDRVGIALRERTGEFRLLTGNEVGVLLLDYICSQRLHHGEMPPKPVFVKTIVTTDMAEQVAAHYGVETRNVLTGFKFIGEQIGLLEKQGRQEDFLLGFEESYGYLAGSYVRDKDGVFGAYMICEMAGFYAAQGIRLEEKLEALYKTYGFRINTLHSYTFEGAAGFRHMEALMTKFRGSFPIPFETCLDYAQGLDGLPKSDVLKFFLKDGAAAVIRPSGTEPKLKLYLSVVGQDRAQAENKAENLKNLLEKEILG